MSFKNPIFNNQKIQIDENNHSDLSDDDNQINLNQTQPDSSKALYFINSLCIESLKNSSPSSTSQQSLVHSASRQSLQQPLFVLNNSYMTRSTQSLASSANINTPIKTNNSTSTTYYCVKAQDQFNGTKKRQSIVSSQQLLPPKMGVKALNHNSTSNKVRFIYSLKLLKNKPFQRKINT